VVRLLQFDSIKPIAMCQNGAIGSLVYGLLELMTVFNSIQLVLDGF